MRPKNGTYDGGRRPYGIRARSRGLSGHAGAIVLLGLALSVAYAGCGGAVAPKRTRPRRQTIAFTSPSLVVGNGALRAAPTIPVRYTCDGSDTTPSFKWGPVPSNTVELALFMLKVNSSTPSTSGSVQVSVEWGVAGLPSNIHGFPAGKLPPGAITSRKRYSVCPAKGSAGTYVFQLSALAQRLGVAQGFDPAGLFSAVEGATVGAGNFTSTYKRA